MSGDDFKVPKVSFSDKAVIRPLPTSGEYEPITMEDLKNMSTDGTKPREWKLIHGMCERSGPGEMGEFDRQEIRELKSEYDAALKSFKLLSEENDGILAENISLTAKLKIAIDALEMSREQMRCWANEIVNWNVPAEHHSNRLKEVGIGYIDKALDEIRGMVSE